MPELKGLHVSENSVIFLQPAALRAAFFCAAPLK
jgi:hypothetical protein